MRPISEQIFWLLILAVAVACVARTVIYEEIFREVREWFERHSNCGTSVLKRKFCYLFTCEYCFSHWVALLFVTLMQFKLLLPDWRGYVIAFFALVFVANGYLNLYSRLRVDITSEKKDIERKEKEIEQMDEQAGDGKTRRNSSKSRTAA